MLATARRAAGPVSDMIPTRFPDHAAEPEQSCRTSALKLSFVHLSHRFRQGIALVFRAPPFEPVRPRQADWLEYYRVIGVLCSDILDTYRCGSREPTTLETCLCSWNAQYRLLFRHAESVCLRVVVSRCAIQAPTQAMVVLNWNLRPCLTFGKVQTACSSCANANIVGIENPDQNEPRHMAGALALSNVENARLLQVERDQCVGNTG